MIQPSQATEQLQQLALDLRWSWNHAADHLWRRLDPQLWDLTHNPWIIIQTVSKQKLEAFASDQILHTLLDDLQEQRRTATESPAWYQQTHANSKLTTVAYFSMEFMLSEALPIYSGGLGNVAGDQLKAASDLGVPVVGVGLLYQRGYFRQEIDPEGRQRALYPYNDPGQLPISPVRDPSGEWLRIAIDLPDSTVWLRTWQVQVGRTRLYLLDSNDPANLPAHRGITSELYGGGPDLRLKQELVLGIAGWRLLRALKLQPEVCHLNEGHAAFATLERALDWMNDHQHPFEIAHAITRAGNVFTTHTPVEAGFDRFPPELLEPYLRPYAEQHLKIPWKTLLSLGRLNPDNPSEPFNMAFLACRASARVNGVSRLHGEVSRLIFQPLFPRWPASEVPVAYVTNGVHVPSWDSAQSDHLWTQSCGKGRWLGNLGNVSYDLQQMSDSDLWELRTESRKCLIEYARRRLARQLAGQGATPQQIEISRTIFDPNTLMLGFARRFATYKRPNLLLHDPQRFVEILTNQQRPVQLIIAGKAHPADLAGQSMITEWITFLRRPEVRPHVVFLSDYDMLLTERLVQGVDLWINTPRRPWEACGTSGMKVLVNGGLNVSELDGWWAEAYSPDAGWSLGDGNEHGDDPAWDGAEAEQFYALLENQIIPEFYTRNDQGIPGGWVAKMRESMSRLTPAFSSNRTVRQYTDEYYLPASEAFLERAKNRGQLGAAFVEWQRQLDLHWDSLRFGQVRVEPRRDVLHFSVPVYLNELDPESIQVELYAEPGTRIPMQRGSALSGARNSHLYEAEVPAYRSGDHYTPRLIPYRPGAFVPLEANQILWQR